MYYEKVINYLVETIINSTPLCLREHSVLDLFPCSA